MYRNTKISLCLGNHGYMIYVSSSRDPVCMYKHISFTFPPSTNGSWFCPLLCIFALLTVHFAVVWHLSIDRYLIFLESCLFCSNLQILLWNPWWFNDFETCCLLCIPGFCTILTGSCLLLERCLSSVSPSRITSVTRCLQIYLLFIDTFILASFLTSLLKLNFK